MIIKNGSLFCDDGFFRKLNLEISNEKIANIGSHDDDYDALNAQDCYVVPGFVDIHIHGAMGVDFSDGESSGIETIAKFLLSQGVTSFLGTTMALPEEQLSKICKTAKPFVGKRSPGMAVLRGINMEGPFFNEEKRGAQNKEYIIPPDIDMFNSLNNDSGGNILTVALAPETVGGIEFIKSLSKKTSISLAHTNADYNTATTAFKYGANRVTHIFNGMPPFHHRDPGVVGAAIDEGRYAELICDGEHVHPSMVKSVFCLFGDDKVCLISDAMRACGMPEGQYDLGGQTVTVSGGVARIASGSLAGSVSSLTDCVRKAVGFGIELEAVLKAATINPAKSVGIQDVVGSISVGKNADILVLNRDLTIRHVILNGKLQLYS